MTEPRVDTLDAAWAAVEAVLPEGWVIDALHRIYGAGFQVDAWAVRAVFQTPRTGPLRVAVKETPAAALLALAAAIRAGAPPP